MGSRLRKSCLDPGGGRGPVKMRYIAEKTRIKKETLFVSRNGNMGGCRGEDELLDECAFFRKLPKKKRNTGN